jgi:hypothetical protein
LALGANNLLAALGPVLLIPPPRTRIPWSSQQPHQLFAPLSPRNQALKAFRARPGFPNAFDSLANFGDWR